MWTIRTRWAAIGAAVAVTLGAGGIGLAGATIDSGERPVFVPVEPCRLFDTRPAPDTVGARSTPLGADETHTATAHGTNGDCTLPTDAVGLSLNVTTIDATLPTFVTVWPGGARPKASSLNPAPGQPPTPNAVNTPLSDTGTFDVYNLQGTVNIIVDVNGYYADHNHDDRYIRTTEGRRLPFAFGRVNADGTLGAHEGNVTTTWNAGLLRYEIAVNPGVMEVGFYTNITMVTPADSNCGSHTALTTSMGGTEYVFLVRDGGSKVQCAFEFVVYRDRQLAIPF